MQIHLIIVCCITVLVTFSNVLSIALLVYVALGKTYLHINIKLFL